jgi:hypothetical protein
MAEMTDEEADALDEYYTKNPPEIDPDTNGGFAARSFKMIAVDRLSENYLLTKAMATHKTPTEIIGELVRERIGHETETATAVL